MKCKLCGRRAEYDLCEYHLEAKAELETGYRYWAEAYGSLEWNEYLARVSRNSETGVWAVEVAKMMLGSP